MTAPSDRTDRLARFLCALDAANVPQRIRERAKDLVLDHLGVSLHGLSLPWSRIIADYAEAEGGRAEATLYGRARVGARTAALANATIGHGIELDDTHDESLSHPGAVVIPAALAVAEAAGASGDDLIAGIVAGYEAQCRAGAAATGELMFRGFHPTATAGVFGATAAAARVLRLDADALQSAWGLAASMASGVTQFTEDPSGTMVKRLHAGIPAHNGVMAAQLAARGFRGPRGALDGRRGFIRVFGAEPDEARLVAGLGEVWEIDKVSIKLYACCRMFHALIDAIHETRAADGWRSEEIVEAHAYGPRLMSEGHMQYRPQSVMSAQYSLPYVVAATLLLDPRDPGSFSEGNMVRADVLAMADRVAGQVDPALERLFPAQCAGRIRLRTGDGRTFERMLTDSVGTPARPVDRAGIAAKFHALADDVVGADRAALIRSTVMRMETDGATPVARLLGAA